MFKTKIASTTAAVAIACGLIATPAANALPARDLGPANPTTIGEHCTNPGDTGQTVKIKRTYFDGSAGSWTISNYNDEPLPVTRSIKETKTKTWNVSAGVDFKLLDLINFTFSSSYTDSQSYEVGEQVGPYNIAPGKTAVMRAGWVVSDFEARRPSAVPITLGRPTVRPSPLPCRRSATWRSPPATTTIGAKSC